jgi:hypothetical protein
MVSLHCCIGNGMGERIFAYSGGWTQRLSATLTGVMKMVWLSQASARIPLLSRTNEHTEVTVQIVNPLIILLMPWWPVGPTLTG